MLWAPAKPIESFHAPLEAREGPDTLDEILDDNLHLSDALWLEDLTVRPTSAQCTQKTRFSAQVEHFLYP